MTPLIDQPNLAFQPERVDRFHFVIGRLPDGSPLFIPVQLICGAQPGPRLAVVAGVHGDELEGVRAIQALIADLQPAQLAGSLLLIPVANVMALNAVARRSPLDQVDLNRVFPGRPDGSVSERLAHHLCADLLAGSDVVVSLHGWSQNGMVEPWMEFVDLPGAVGDASHAAAAAFGIPDLVPLPLLSGRLISALAAMGIPAIEGEVGGQATFVEPRWRIYRRGLDRLMAHLGMKPAPDSETAPIAINYWALRAVTAPVGGLFLPDVSPGAPVDEGQRLGEVVDLFGAPLAELLALWPGKVASMQTVGVAQPGSHLFTILQPAPFA
jgi:predicted deacylase